MIELAQRVIKCKHWRWMAGMLARGENPTSGNPAWVRLREFHSSLTLGGQANQVDNVYPDLNDPATIGCLLSLVREAWGGQFTVCGEDQLKTESLVKALEAAPDDTSDWYNCAHCEAGYPGQECICEGFIKGEE